MTSSSSWGDDPPPRLRPSPTVVVPPSLSTASILAGRHVHDDNDGSTATRNKSSTTVINNNNDDDDDAMALMVALDSALMEWLLHDLILLIEHYSRDTRLIVVIPSTEGGGGYSGGGGSHTIWSIDPWAVVWSYKSSSPPSWNEWPSYFPRRQSPSIAVYRNTLVLACGHILSTNVSTIVTLPMPRSTSIMAMNESKRSTIVMYDDADDDTLKRALARNAKWNDIDSIQRASIRRHEASCVAYQDKLFMVCCNPNVFFLENASVG
jgi:hypothetical protein